MKLHTYESARISNQSPLRKTLLAALLGCATSAQAITVEVGGLTVSPESSTGWLSAQRHFSAPFTGVIGFGVVDQSDTDIHTLLLIDNLTVDGQAYSGLEPGDPQPSLLRGPASITESFQTLTLHLPDSGNQMLALSTGGDGDAYPVTGNAFLVSNGYMEGAFAEWAVNWAAPTTLGFRLLFETFEFGSPWNDIGFLYWDSTPGDDQWDGVMLLAAAEVPEAITNVPLSPAATLFASGVFGLLVVARRASRYTDQTPP